jgi:hypothetical protein
VQNIIATVALDDEHSCEGVKANGSVEIEGCVWVERFGIGVRPEWSLWRGGVGVLSEDGVLKG